MYIEIGNLAAQRLREALGDRPGTYRLFIDTEDCGCNGVIVLQILDEPGRFDTAIDTNHFPFIIDAKQRENFDESMRLEAEEHYPVFRLSSDSGLFGSNIRVRDDRGSAGGVKAASDAACRLPER